MELRDDGSANSITLCQNFGQSRDQFLPRRVSRRNADAIRKAIRSTLELFFLAFGPIYGWHLEVCERKTNLGHAKFATTLFDSRKRTMPEIPADYL